MVVKLHNKRISEELYTCSKSFHHKQAHTKTNSREFYIWCEWAISCHLTGRSNLHYTVTMEWASCHRLSYSPQGGSIGFSTLLQQDIVNTDVIVATAKQGYLNAPSPYLIGKTGILMEKLSHVFRTLIFVFSTSSWQGKIFNTSFFYFLEMFINFFPLPSERESRDG